MGANQLMGAGDSITLGQQSTAAIHTGGYRWVLQQLATAAGKAISWTGDTYTGSWTNNQHCGYSGQVTDIIRLTSAPARTNEQPEGILAAPGSNDIAGGVTTTAQLAVLYATFLDDLFDRQSHQLPGGGCTLKWVACMQLLTRTSWVAQMADFNANFLPGVVAAQIAKGRDVFIVPTGAVTSFSDGTHPDDVGYRDQLAPAWMSAIASRLRAA